MIEFLTSSMLKLQFPEFKYKLIKKEEVLFIYDPTRKIKVVLTPEEWVRQHVLNYLVNHLNYPSKVIKTETSFKVNLRQKRADVVVYGKDGNPFLIVECKAPYVKISEKSIQQISFYHSGLKAKYLILTNGIANKICCLDEQIHFISQFPDYPFE